MKTTALVSVIIPVYNSAKYLDACIASILNQTYSNIEIVLCDDCSTDNSRNILEKYKSDKRCKILYNTQNMHQAYTRNKCLEICSGEYILMQDSDDISVPNRIEKLLSVFESEKIDFVGSSCFYFDDDGMYGFWHIGIEYPQRVNLLTGIPFVHASIMFKKNILNFVNGYRISKMTRRGEDYDLILRLYAAGFLGKNIDDELYGYRVDKNAYARRTLWSRIDEMKIRYYGYKSNHILIPFGIFFIFEPILAYFYHKIRIFLFNYKK